MSALNTVGYSNRCCTANAFAPSRVDLVAPDYSSPITVRPKGAVTELPFANSNRRGLAMSRTQKYDTRRGGLMTQALLSHHWLRYFFFCAHMTCTHIELYDGVACRLRTMTIGEGLTPESGLSSASVYLSLLKL